eukprot:CAMPEP_0172440746 /NCGR_PEP_ID=MMETSP1065-20121228/1363_1 /TAXON_ID=265537 /ORGANISM="Amphiprora paludosa, Strain CCMP125" /LENGTH=148 /DNA_ID=CAMNT_0013189739 /DNA_START=26 /DNA_END=469 /DNA_ORIENTATION=-
MALVVETWGEIQKIPEYEEVAGVLLFKNIFKVEPAAQNIFSFGQEFDIGSEKIFEDRRFIAHAKTVIGMVTAAIGLLEKGEMEKLINVLRDLGARHVSYDVVPEHYPIVGEALITTLAAALGDSFTAEVKRQWLHVADVIFTTMATTW